MTVSRLLLVAFVRFWGPRERQSPAGACPSLIAALLAAAAAAAQHAVLDFRRRACGVLRVQ